MSIIWKIQFSLFSEFKFISFEGVNIGNEMLTLPVQQSAGLIRFHVITGYNT